MEDWIWLVAVGAVVVIGLIAYGAWKAKRSHQVKEQFGPEYERLSSDQGHKSAVSELSERQKRREQLDIQPLSAATADRYSDSWAQAQTRFVDHPDVAVKEADSLVTSVMVERGYPMNDFEQRAADISVDHPNLVTNYRAGHTIAHRAENGEATTEELRQAMVHYRALFEELLETDGADDKRQETQRSESEDTFRPQR
ncbi:MAG: hypothetical protein M3198_06330 [Actinomycetota bacterium]|nr:hypothetical protein [Actinomycetota bacterium]